MTNLRFDMGGKTRGGSETRFSTKAEGGWVGGMWVVVVIYTWARPLWASTFAHECKKTKNANNTKMKTTKTHKITHKS